jgi:hypothetical protein
MIVSTVRVVGRFAGKVIDADDRRVLGQGLIIGLGLVLMLLVLAVSAGLAVRAFGMAAG